MQDFARVRPKPEIAMCPSGVDIRGPLFSKCGRVQSDLFCKGEVMLNGIFSDIGSEKQ